MKRNVNWFNCDKIYYFRLNYFYFSDEKPSVKIAKPNPFYCKLN